MNKPTLKEQAHGEIEKIFRILLPQNGLAVREEQITLCHTMLDKEGHFAFRYKNFLGYRPGENGEPEIDPEQAAIVSRIFFAFLSGDTPEQIAKSLEADHIPSPTGKPTWSKTTIRNMLQNEKYAGDVLLQKTYTADFLEKKVKKNRGEVKQYYMGLKKLLYSIIIINIKKNASVVRKRVSDFQKNFLKYTGNRMVTGCQ